MKIYKPSYKKTIKKWKKKKLPKQKLHKKTKIYKQSGANKNLQTNSPRTNESSSWLLLVRTADTSGGRMNQWTNESGGRANESWLKTNGRRSRVVEDEQSRVVRGWRRTVVRGWRRTVDGRGWIRTVDGRGWRRTNARGWEG